MAEVVIQQLRAAETPTNPPPQFRATSQKQVTEGGAFKALTKYTGNPSDYHDWSFNARRVLTRADERFGGLLQWISRQVDEVKKSDVFEYRRTTDLSTTDYGMAQLGTARAVGHEDIRYSTGSIKSLEEVEVKGIIGWQRLEREARGYHRHRVAILTESVTHPERVQKATDLPQAFYRWESKFERVSMWRDQQNWMMTCRPMQ